MLITGIAIYVVIAFIITVIDIEQPSSEGLKILILSLVLTPLYSLFVLIKRRHHSVKIHYYYCEHCDYVYPVKLKYCPVCEEKGIKVKLIKYESPHKLTEFYKQLTLA